MVGWLESDSPRHSSCSSPFFLLFSVLLSVDSFCDSVILGRLFSLSFSPCLFSSLPLFFLSFLHPYVFHTPYSILHVLAFFLSFIHIHAWPRTSYLVFSFSKLASSNYQITFFSSLFFSFFFFLFVVSARKFKFRRSDLGA